MTLFSFITNFSDKTQKNSLLKKTWLAAALYIQPPTIQTKTTLPGSNKFSSLASKNDIFYNFDRH